MFCITRYSLLVFTYTSDDDINISDCFNKVNYVKSIQADSVEAADQFCTIYLVLSRLDREKSRAVGLLYEIQKKKNKQICLF